MATSDTELEEEVRVMTGYDTAVLPSSQFQTVISRAKSFLINRRSLENDDVDWFGNPRAEEALYWGVCFFAKVKTGEVKTSRLEQLISIPFSQRRITS